MLEALCLHLHSLLLTDLLSRHLSYFRTFLGPYSLKLNGLSLVLHLWDREPQTQLLPALTLLCDVTEGELDHDLSKSGISLAPLDCLGVPNHVIDLRNFPLFI